MAFQGSSKNYLDILIAPLNSHFYTILVCFARYFSFKLNESVIALATLKLTISTLASVVSAHSDNFAISDLMFSNNYFYILINHPSAFLY